MKTIKDLKKAIKGLPDDMPVAINESCAEATGLANWFQVINGADDEDLPYDKGDGIYDFAWSREEAGSPTRIKQDTKIFFISS